MQLGFAQEVTVEEGSYLREKVERPGIRATLYPAPKEVKKAFKDYLKKNYGIKLDGIGFLTNKDELYAKDVSFEEISQKNMNLYAEIIKSKESDNTQMTIYGALGYDIYLAPRSRYAYEFSNLKKVVDGFLNRYLVDYYEEQLEKAEETLSNVEKDKQKIANNIDNKEATIEQNKSEIEALRKEIERLRKELTDKEKQLISVEENYEERMKKLKAVKKDLNEIE